MGANLVRDIAGSHFIQVRLSEPRASQFSPRHICSGVNSHAIARKLAHLLITWQGKFAALETEEAARVCCTADVSLLPHASAVARVVWSSTVNPQA
jgi:hypothetical protein